MRISKILIGLLMFGFASSASAEVITMQQIQNAVRAGSLATMGLIDWKVGDNAEMSVELGGLGMKGTMHKEATKEEGNAVWIKQQLSLPIMKDTSELLIDRDSGKTLKYIHNGKEEAVPTSDLEIVKTETVTIEVPAGKFRVMHIIAKSKDVKDIQLWANPNVIALDGAAKMYMDQGQIKITMLLTKFNKQPQQ